MLVLEAALREILETQDLINTATTFMAHFPVFFLFSPSIVILLGLRKWYYHLQASFAAFVLAAKVPRSATRSFYCPP